MAEDPKLCLSCGEKPAVPGSDKKVAMCVACQKLSEGHERGVVMTAPKPVATAPEAL